MTDDDLSRAQWKKSSYSGNSGNCVEVSIADKAIGVRDSKDFHGKMLVFTPIDWDAFIRGVKDNEFEL